MKIIKKKNIRDNELRYYCFFSMFLLFAAAFLFASPNEIFQGMKVIIQSRDALITDYFELAGYGPAFFNAGIMMLISMALIEYGKLPYTGMTLAVIFISVGFGFWGKNPINIIPIIFGTWVYAAAHNAKFSRYVYTALFATCLAPFVTELVFVLPFTYEINLILAVSVGVFFGYVIPPLAMHTASMHMGYNLFNVGFAAGSFAFVFYCVLKTHGIESEAVFIWKTGRHPGIIAVLAIYFIATFIWGACLEYGRFEGIIRIMRHPGRAVADFVMMDGIGNTLMNMAIMGLLTEVYLVFVDGDLSGPILGCILTVYGFSAFGAHMKNYVPVLLGVALSTVFSNQDPNTPVILIASYFCVGLSPIAGQFGTFAGLAAGLLHSSVVMCTSQMYGGLNLYNNGFSCGWVSIVMVPIVESFMKHFEYRKQRKMKGTAGIWFMKKRK